jgi:prephenate dehydrogenase
VINQKYWGFAASGLRDTTRIASGDPGLWLSISKQNKVRITEALRSFSEEIRSTLQDLEQGNSDKILKTLKKAKIKRDKKQWKQE